MTPLFRRLQPAQKFRITIGAIALIFVQHLDKMLEYALERARIFSHKIVGARHAVPLP